MTLKEFTDRTNFYPTQVQWEQINEEYMNCTDDKDTFCRRWVKRSLLNSSRDSAFQLERYTARRNELVERQNELRKQMGYIDTILNIASNKDNQQLIQEFYRAYNSLMAKIDEIQTIQ